MRIPAMVFAFSVMPLTAIAQIGNPAFMAPDTQFDGAGVPAPNQPNTADKVFVQLLAEGGLAEVELGQLAADRTSAAAVESFAQRMIEDHTTANEELAALADQNMIPRPETLNAEHAALLATLEDLDDAELDLAYMRAQVIDHQKTATMLMWEIDSGQEAGLQQFAAQTLPTVLEHLRLAQEIVTELSREPQGD